MEDWDYDVNGEDCREDDPATEEEESEDPSELYKYSCRDDGGEPDDPYDSDYGPDLATRVCTKWATTLNANSGRRATCVRR